MKIDLIKKCIYKRLDGKVGWSVTAFCDGGILSKFIIKSSSDSSTEQDAIKEMNEVINALNIPKNI